MAGGALVAAVELDVVIKLSSAGAFDWAWGIWPGVNDLRGGRMAAVARMRTVTAVATSR